MKSEQQQIVLYDSSYPL